MTSTDDEGSGVFADAEITVRQENAVPNYAGLLFVKTDPQHQNDLSLELRAVVQDITFFNNTPDVEGGDITRDDIATATVTFVITNLDGPGS